MEKYYKQINEAGELVLLLTYGFQPKITNPLIVQITEDEYNALSDEIEAENQPEEPATDEDEISAEEALDIILGVSE